jgi:hypothetical protein
MKIRTLVSILILVLALIIVIGGCATGKKVTKKDYKFFEGTWINEEYNSHPFPAKYVMRRDGTYDKYNRISDTGKLGTGHYIIKGKWIDSEGNIWYKMHVWGGVIVETRADGYEIDKFSNSGKVWEFIAYGDDYPTEIDESNLKYHIYYRQE